jgi:hypothetical protein
VKTSEELTAVLLEIGRMAQARKACIRMPNGMMLDNFIGQALASEPEEKPQPQTRAGHTPGTWKQIIAQPGTMLEIVNEQGEYVCSLLGGDEHKAENARLIALAPEMMRALSLCVARLEEYQDAEGGIALRLARAILAKVEGRAE